MRVEKFKGNVYMHNDCGGVSVHTELGKCPDCGIWSDVENTVSFKCPMCGCKK